MAADLAGTTIGPYRVVRTLGAGTSGVVVEAEEPGLERRVAIKLLTGGQRATANQLERFRREREALARLRDPHVVRVHAAGSHQGTPYVVMELLDGRTLRHLLRGEEPLPLARALVYGQQLADGLAALHQAGLVHRDVKPENVLVSGEGQLKLADLGLAVHDDDPRLTESGALLGTPEYMAPEALKGARIRAPTADVYSLGVVLFELLTGAPPHPAPNLAALVFTRCTQPQVDPRRLRGDIPAALAEVCLRALAGPPEQRFQDAGELARALRAAAPGLGRTGASLLPAGIAAAGLGLVVALALLGGAQDRPVTRTAPEVAPAGSPSALPAPGSPAAEPRPGSSVPASALVDPVSAWERRAAELRALVGAAPSETDPAWERLRELEREPLARWELEGLAAPAVAALEEGRVAFGAGGVITLAGPRGPARQVQTAHPPGGLLRSPAGLLGLVGGAPCRIRLDPGAAEALGVATPDARLLVRAAAGVAVVHGDRGVAVLSPDLAGVQRLRVGQGGEVITALSATGDLRAGTPVTVWAALVSSPGDPAGITATLTWWVAADEVGPPTRRPLPAARTLAFAPHRPLLAVGGSDGGVFLLADPLQQQPTPLPAVGPGERSPVRALAWSGDGRRLYAALERRDGAAGPGGIAVWDVQRGALLRVFGGAGTSSLDVSPDGLHLVAGRPGAVEVWSLAGDLLRVGR